MRRKQCPFGGSWLLEPLWNHRSHDPSLPHLIASLFLGETWWNHILSSLSPAIGPSPFSCWYAHVCLINLPISWWYAPVQTGLRLQTSHWCWHGFFDAAGAVGPTCPTEQITWPGAESWSFQWGFPTIQSYQLPKRKKIETPKADQKETIGFSKSYQLLWRSRAPPPDPPGLPFGVTTLHPWSPDTWHDVWRQKMGYTKHKFGDENIGKWGFSTTGSRIKWGFIVAGPVRKGDLKPWEL